MTETVNYKNILSVQGETILVKQGWAKNASCTTSIHDQCIYKGLTLFSIDIHFDASTTDSF